MLKIRFERYVKLGECYVTGTGLLSRGMPGNREMLLTNLGREIVKDIDKGVVISKDNIGLPLHDTSIPPSELAGGTQALIYLMSNPSKPIRLSCFGRNCYKYIWEIVNLVDYDIVLSATGREAGIFEYAPKGSYAICENNNSYIYDDYMFEDIGEEFVKYEDIYN